MLESELAGIRRQSLGWLKRRHRRRRIRIWEAATEFCAFVLAFQLCLLGPPPWSTSFVHVAAAATLVPQSRSASFHQRSCSTSEALRFALPVPVRRFDAIPVRRQHRRCVLVSLSSYSSRCSASVPHASISLRRPPPPPRF